MTRNVYSYLLRNAVKRHSPSNNLTTPSSLSSLLSNNITSNYLSLSSSDDQQQQLQPQQRWSSSNTSIKPSSSPPPRDTRLAGRRRFYKIVGITPTPPPWDSTTHNPTTPIDSPITAGVDNTPTIANGITLTPPLTPTSLPLLSPSPSRQWYSITLDSRPLRTPLGNPLSLPSLPLSLAIAAEWDAQTATLSPPQMPLTTLACTTLDQTASHPSIAVEQSLRFFPNDTTCFYADPMEDRVLHRRQSRRWDKLHEWVEGAFGERPAVAVGGAEGLLLSRPRGDRPAGLPHPPSLRDAISRHVSSLNAWELTAVMSAAAEAKSLIVALALIDGGVFEDGASGAVAAGRVEEEFQIENWGLVEGGHDYDRLNGSVQMRAARVFVEGVRLG